MKKDELFAEIKKFQTRRRIPGFLWGFLLGILVVFAVNMSIKLYYENKYGCSFPDGKFFAIADTIEKNYVNDYDKSKLLEGAYLGMVYSLEDKYSTYFTKEEFENYINETKGIYEGIGLYLSFDDESRQAVVVGIFPDSPASNTEIKENDIIISINGIGIKDSESYKSAVNSIKETKDDITVIYKEAESGVTKTVLVSAEEIDIPSIKGEMLEDNIGYIIITSFDEVTLNQFETALSDLQEQGMERLIIDLRDNPGGLMRTVVPITNKFIPKGFVTYTEDKNGKRVYQYSDDEQLGIPLVLLVNGGSASASEVMSGAIKDTGVGKLVGTRTYGKGVVQNMYTFPDGSGMKLTTSKYYTPSGKCINGIGIEPDYEIEYNEPPEGQEYSKENDNQLQKAIEVVKEIE